MAVACPAQDTRLATMVVDITYMCDASCRYCRWGDAGTPERAWTGADDVLIPAQTLSDLRIQKVVISGGEPTLHPRLPEILGYYSRLVDGVVVITNGYGLTPDRVREIIDAGATGFTVSVDSASSKVSFDVRQTRPDLHDSILRRIEDLCARSDVETGINSTVTHATANWENVKGLLEFGLHAGVDCIKFQPVFDDGYVSRTSPDLLLSGRDVEGLLEVSRMVDAVEHPPTNPPAFWEDIAVLAGGGELEGRRCGISSDDAISIRGKASMCFWVSDSSYGEAARALQADTIRGVQRGFDKAKEGCRVGFHCFCNQRIDHVWRSHA